MKRKYRYFFKALLSAITILLISFFFAHSAIAASIPSDFRVTGSEPGTTTIHSFTGLPLTPDGWTDLLALVQSDSRIVYVSTSGDNSTGENYTPDSPEVGSNPFEPAGAVMAYATYVAAFAELRDGYPDILLFKRGDTWSTHPNYAKIDKGGRSQAERLIVGAYGTSGARPILQDTEVAFIIRSSFVVVADLELEAVGRGPTNTGYNGVEFEFSTTDTLLEGNYIHNFKSNVVCQSSDSIGNPVISNIALRRNVIADAWGSNGAHGQGLYTHQINDLLLEENVWDHNGWEETYHPMTVFDRSIYLSRTGGTIVRGNVFARGSSADQMRRGGRYEYNLSLQNPGGISLGHSQSVVDSTSSVKYNVFLDGHDVSGTPSAFGVAVGNRQVNTVVHDNIIAHQVTGTGNVKALTLSNETSMDYQDPLECPAPCYPYASGTTFSSNIVYKWELATGASGNMVIMGQAITDGVVFENNVFHAPQGTEAVRVFSGTQSSGPDASWIFSGNTYYVDGNSTPFVEDGEAYMNFSQWETYVSETDSTSTQVFFSDPDRTIETYAKLIGLNPTEYEDGLNKFLQEARNMTRFNWNMNYTAAKVINYIREGFDREPVSYSYSTP